MKNQVKALRWIGMAEGISFLLLLLIAMPMKYYFGYPMAVKIMGWVHGALFMLYVLFVFYSIEVMAWTWKSTFVALLAAVVPLGPLLLHHSWKKRELELEAVNR